MKYTVVIERTPNNYAAYVPDLPGCVATAGTREELLDEIREAIEFHIEVCERTANPSRNPRLPPPWWKWPPWRQGSEGLERETPLVALK